MQSPGAEVYVCTEKATGKRFAIKEVDREKVRPRISTIETTLNDKSDRFKV